MDRSPITNCWGKVKPRAIPGEERLVFRGRPGLAYSHQAQLTTCQGCLFATWTLGLRDEEGPAEDMVFSVSEDGGDTWSPPRLVASSQPGRAAKTVVVSAGARVVGDAIVAYNGHWDRAAAGIQPDGSRTATNDPALELFCDVRIEARASRDGGATWSPPTTVAPGISNYMTPFTTRTGRVILPGNLTFPWTDDPLGLSGWTWAGVPGLAPGVMDNYFNMVQTNALAGTGQLYNEACCYQLADGALRMMLRNESPTAFRLGVSESRDHGLTWSTPVLTDYTDVICRAHFGRLADGRYFGMSCPNPGTPHRPRSPAILALSQDGTVFDRHFIIGNDAEGGPRYAGLWKHGRYGYPFLHTQGEFGFAIYSINKEDIGITRFRLEALT